MHGQNNIKTVVLLMLFELCLYCHYRCTTSTCSQTDLCIENWLQCLWVWYLQWFYRSHSVMNIDTLVYRDTALTTDTTVMW